MVTRKPKLAICLYSEVMTGSFKEASRRLAWYLRVRFIYIIIADDGMFYFPISNDLLILKDQEEFLDRYKDKRSEIDYLADKMVLQAEALNIKINVSNVLSINEQGVQNYFQSIRTYLVALSNSEVYQNFRYNSVQEVVTFERDRFDFRQNGMECLRCFSELYPLIKYQWFVTGGTCLGLARQNHILSHDFDVDVGLFYRPGLEDELKKIADSSNLFEIMKCDYSLLSSRIADKLENIKRPAFIKLIHKNGVNVDIFFHYEVENKIVHGSSTIGWVNEKFTLKEDYIENLKVLHPDPLGNYLTEHYGDWSIVKKKFSCSTDTDNMYVEKSFVGVAQMLKLLLPNMCKKNSNHKKFLERLKLAGLIFEENACYQFNSSFFLKED